MNKKPLVTILTITLNRESLKHACESVDRQTYPNYYHIVLGDGVLPTDYSNERRMCLGFSKVMGITEPGANMPNGSPNPMQRWALKNIDLGDYVCFLDDDNTYQPDYLEKMVDALEKNPNVGVALCGANDLRYSQPMDGYPEDYRCDNSAFMARRSVVKDIEFPRASLDKNVVQDCEYIKLCSKKYGFVNVPYKLLNFGVADNLPPDRGQIFFLESWKQPQQAYEMALKFKYEEANKIFEDAVKLNSNDAWSMFKIIEIDVLTQNSKLNKDVNDFMTLISKTNQQHSYLDYMRAFCQSLKNENYDNNLKSCIKSISKEIEEDKSNLFFLSAYHLFDKNYKKAIKYYLEARNVFKEDDFWANKEFNWMIRIFSNINQLAKVVEKFNKGITK